MNARWIRIPLCVAMLAMAGLCAPPAAESASWIGPTIAVPLEVGGTGTDPMGIDAGVTTHAMSSRYFGVGLDLAYHYWPVSSDYRARFERYLRDDAQRVIDSPTWAVKAIQLTGHVRLFAPIGHGHGAALQLGGGMYRFDYNLAEPNEAGAVAISLNPQLNATWVPGWYSSAGFDWRTGSNTVIGIDAAFHHVMPFKKDVPDFSAFTVGTHVLFAW